MVKYIKSSRDDNFYLVDVGVLLTENDEEFESYNMVYDEKFGYYDEHMYYVADEDSAISQAKDYVQKGNPNTYGVVSYAGSLYQWVDLDDESISDEEIDSFLGDLDVADEDYLVENIVYSVYKDKNGKLVENFIV